MPEGIVQVTEGTGKKLHTFQRVIGANTVEDEVVLYGEQYTATYIAGMTPPASTATLASHLFQLMAGATLKVRVRRIEMHISTPATAAALADIQLLRLSTAGTGGTAANPVAFDSTDATAGATGMVLPTVKGTEGTLLIRAYPYMIQTIAASAGPTNPVLVWDFDRPRSKPLIIAAGAANGIAVKNAVAIAGATVLTLVWLDETNF